MNGFSNTLKILLVDDSSSNRYLAGLLLRRDGHDVAEARNGKEALQSLAEELFDIVLMDFRMPEMDGLSAIGYIRALEQGDGCDMPELDGLAEQVAVRLAGKHQYVVAVTAEASETESQGHRAARFDDWLFKPYRPEELQRVVEGYLASVGDDAPAPINTVVLEDRIRCHLKNSYGLAPDEVVDVFNIYMKTTDQTRQRLWLALQ